MMTENVTGNPRWQVSRRGVLLAWVPQCNKAERSTHVAPMEVTVSAPTLLTLFHPLRAATLALEMEHTLVAQLSEDYPDHVAANARAFGLDF